MCGTNLAPGGRTTWVEQVAVFLSRVSVALRVTLVVGPSESGHVVEIATTRDHGFPPRRLGAPVGKRRHAYMGLIVVGNIIVVVVVDGFVIDSGTRASHGMRGSFVPRDAGFATVTLRVFVQPNHSRPDTYSKRQTSH